MARHTVTIKEIEDFLAEDSWKRCAGSFCKGSNKRLEANTRGEFRVISHNLTRYVGRDVKAATDACNEAP